MKISWNIQVADSIRKLIPTSPLEYRVELCRLALILFWQRSALVSFE